MPGSHEDRRLGMVKSFKLTPGVLVFTLEPLYPP